MCTKILLILVLLYAFIPVHGQTKSAGGDSSKKSISLDDITFTKLEVEAQYPGGDAAWKKFLLKNLRYPDDAVNNEIQGEVIIAFIVDREGNISDISPVSGPKNGGLREEGIRLIKLSGKWTPGMQNGRVVRSYKKVPFIFKMEKG